MIYLLSIIMFLVGVLCAPYIPRFRLITAWRYELLLRRSKRLWRIHSMTVSYKDRPTKTELLELTSYQKDEDKNQFYL